MNYMSIFCFTAFCCSFVEANPHPLLPRADDQPVAKCADNARYPQPGYLDCTYALQHIEGEVNWLDAEGPTPWGPLNLRLEGECGTGWSSGE